MSPFPSLDGFFAADITHQPQDISAQSDPKLGKVFLEKLTQLLSDSQDSPLPDNGSAIYTADFQNTDTSSIALLNFEEVTEFSAPANDTLILDTAAQSFDLEEAPEVSFKDISTIEVSVSEESRESEPDTRHFTGEGVSGATGTDTLPFKEDVQIKFDREEDSESRQAAQQLQILSGLSSELSEGENAQPPLLMQRYGIREAGSDQTSLGYRPEALSADELQANDQWTKPSPVRDKTPLEVQAPERHAQNMASADFSAVQVSAVSVAGMEPRNGTEATALSVQLAPKPSAEAGGETRLDASAPQAPPLHSETSPQIASAETTSVGDFVTSLAPDTATAPSDDFISPSLSVSAGPTAPNLVSSTHIAQPAIAAAHAQAHYVAVPDDIASIISQELSSDNQNNRIRIQLDPPELGRVSLEFKFDSQGLQHVLVTADSAEAIRRIRAFHPDLVSVLEQNGLSSQDMTFREQASGQNAMHDWAGAETMLSEEEPDSLPAVSSPLSQTTQARLTTSGLDIRV